IWSKVWWETVHLKLEAESKHFIIPYHLYICMEFKLNNQNFIITVLPDSQNKFKSGFQCACNTIKSDVESHPSAAIKACYQKIFETRTEYSGLIAMGFNNENIIQQLIANIEFFPIFLQIEKLNVVITSIGDLDENKFHGVGTGFVSLFTMRYRGEQYLFLLRIKENQCRLEIYLESICVNRIIEQTPDDVWKQVEIYKKYTRTYLFGITNELVLERIEMLKRESPTCTPNEWMNVHQLEKIFKHYIKSQKITNPKPS
ncbi:17044_t:CDS:1, partial [Racocetra persica]